MQHLHLNQIYKAIALAFGFCLVSNTVAAAPTEDQSGLFADGTSEVVGDEIYPDGKIQNVESGLTATSSGSISFTTNTINIQSNHYGIWKDSDGSKINLGTDNSTTSILVEDGSMRPYGIYAKNQGELLVKGDYLNIGVDYNGFLVVNAIGVYADESAKVDLATKNIDIFVTNNKFGIGDYANGVEVKNNGMVTLGGSDTELVSLTVESNVKDNKGGVNNQRLSSALSSSNAVVDVRSKEIFINVTGFDAAGINLSNNGQVSVGDENTQTVSIITSANSDPKDKPENEKNRISSAITANSGHAEILGSNIILDTKGYGSTTVAASNGAEINIGNEKSSINISTQGSDSSVALRSDGLNSSINIQADALSISANSKDGLGIGLMSLNSTQESDRPENAASITIRANSTNISSSSVGIAAYSNSHVHLDSNLLLDAPTAIEARGNSLTEINPNNDKVIQINGDISFATTSTGSGNLLDADVRLNLSGADSYWTGNVKREYPESNDNVEKEIQHGVSLSLSDSAQWNPTELESNATSSDGNKIESIALNALDINDGIVNLAKATQEIKIQNLSGKGGTFNLPTVVESDKLTAAHVNVATVASSTSLNVHYTGITADDMVGSEISDIEGGVQALGAEQTRTVAQGAVMGAITEKVNAQGEVYETTQAENTRLNAYGSVASLGILQWRHEMNDLTKRMGELRTSSEGVGAWARLYGSEQEYGSQNVTNKNTSIQVGADFDVGSGWKVGAAFTYTDGSSDYDAGKADNKGYGFGVYGTWVSESGQFVDLIAKYHRLDTDFQLEGMDGSYDNNAFSVSAEYGWHFKLGEAAFIEPQAEITYGRLTGDDFATSNGVRVQQDDFDSLVGRIGVRAGFSFPNDKGTIYARVSGLHDFQGDFDSKASLVNNAAVSQNIHEDLGDTWVEFGVGANFNWTENTYTYIDLERSNGGEIKENWRWNVGVRHVF